MATSIEGVFVDGGLGNDVITGSAGGDTLKGGVGADTVSGGDGDDVILETAFNQNGAAGQPDNLYAILMRRKLH